MSVRYCLFALTAAVLLSACSEQEKILTGERFDVRVPLSVTAGRVSDPESEEVVYINLLKTQNLPEPVRLPDMRSDRAWPQLNGGPDHRIDHPALSGSPLPVWRADIGAGNSRRQRITAAPVSAAGYVFAMDSQSRVTAHLQDGSPVWSVSLVPPSEEIEETAGGGLAYDDGTLYVTTGFGRLHALRASTGELFWSQKFSAPASFAPMVVNGLVFVVTQDGQAWAVETRNGRLRQNWQSVPTATGAAAGSTPAARDDIAVIPYPSGEVQAVGIDDGGLIWSTTVGGSRGASGRSSFRPITSAPVIDGDTVYVANLAGKMAAIDITTGEVLWTAAEGSSSPVWPASGSVFVVSDAGELVRLDGATGKRIWGVPLPFYEGGFYGRRESVFTNFGPVLAGGRMVVASGDSRIRFFDPVNGRLVSSIETRSGAAAAPIVVRGVLYLVDEDGSLTAYR